MIPATEISWQLEWGDRVYFSHLTEALCGVAILSSPSLQPEILWDIEVVLGHLLHLTCSKPAEHLCLVYNSRWPGSTSRWPPALVLSTFTCAWFLMGCLMSLSRCRTAKARSKARLLPTSSGGLSRHSLVDVWCTCHPHNTMTFTFVRVKEDQVCHSWLDQIYLSVLNTAQVHTSGIRPALFSNHHLVYGWVILQSRCLGLAYCTLTTAC